MEKTVNPLEKYIKESGESKLSFSRKCKIAASTIYGICRGNIPHRMTAIQICRHSQGKLKPEDFGWVRETQSGRFYKNLNRVKIDR